MPRRRWIKFWTQETLYGTTSRELRLDEQACWFKLLALAGDSPEPGKVEVAPGIPMTDQQIAGIVGAPLNTWLRTKDRLLAPDVGKIFVNNGIIHIKNWQKYQSEWERVKRYPSQEPTKEPTDFPTDFPTENPTNELSVGISVGIPTENPTRIPEEEEEEEGDDISAATTRGKKAQKKEKNELAVISNLYEQNIGQITPMVAEKLRALADTYPAGWFKEALGEAVGAGVRKLNYIESILERWRVEGYKSARGKPPGRGKAKRPGRLSTQEELEAQAREKGVAY